jgi:hypothetical protein
VNNYFLDGIQKTAWLAKMANPQTANKLMLGVSLGMMKVRATKKSVNKYKTALTFR